jgi:hypothetical protein
MRPVDGPQNKYSMHGRPSMYQQDYCDRDDLTDDNCPAKDDKPKTNGDFENFFTNYYNKDEKMDQDVDTQISKKEKDTIF